MERSQGEAGRGGEGKLSQDPEQVLHCPVGSAMFTVLRMDLVSEGQVALRKAPTVTLGSPFLQAPISDVPRFVLFFIFYGLQLLLFLVSGFSDVAPETKEIRKKV